VLRMLAICGGSWSLMCLLGSEGAAHSELNVDPHQSCTGEVPDLSPENTFTLQRQHHYFLGINNWKATRYVKVTRRIPQHSTWLLTTSGITTSTELDSGTQPYKALPNSGFMDETSVVNHANGFQYLNQVQGIEVALLLSRYKVISTSERGKPPSKGHCNRLSRTR
jgi:hypothetical protein